MTHCQYAVYALFALSVTLLQFWLAITSSINHLSDIAATLGTHAYAHNIYIFEFYLLTFEIFAFTASSVFPSLSLLIWSKYFTIYILLYIFIHSIKSCISSCSLIFSLRHLITTLIIWSSQFEDIRFLDHFTHNFVSLVTLTTSYCHAFMANTKYYKVMHNYTRLYFFTWF